MPGLDSQLRWRFEPLDRFADNASEWRRLADRYPAAPFYQLDFIEPMLRHFACGREQVAIGEQVGAVRAMCILSPAQRGRRNTFQPSQLPLGPIVLDAGISIDRALSSLGRQLSFSTLATGFTQLDEDMYPRPDGSESLAVGDYIQTAWVEVKGTFDEYWQSRGKNLRQNIRKQRRKLVDDGVEAQLDVLRDPGSVANAVEDYGRLESVGWKASGGTAIHPSNTQGHFYREMLERFSAKGRGCIYRYRFSGQVVAVDLCIESDHTLVILKTTYDESIKNLSPAFLMREEAFARIWREGRIQRIEFFGKLMDWHKRWTDNARQIYHLTNYRWSWVKRLRARPASSAPVTEAAAND